jgi:hypothetical protein
MVGAHQVLGVVQRGAAKELRQGIKAVHQRGRSKHVQLIAFDGSYRSRRSQAGTRDARTRDGDLLDAVFLCRNGNAGAGNDESHTSLCDCTSQHVHFGRICFAHSPLHGFYIFDALFVIFSDVQRKDGDFIGEQESLLFICGAQIQQKRNLVLVFNIVVTATLAISKCNRLCQGLTLQLV